MHQTLRTLDMLPIGEQAVVQRVDCAPRVGRRLMEMGLLPGTQVEMVRRAPFGDPIEIRLRGYRLSLRRAEAAGVALTSAGAAAAAPSAPPVRFPPHAARAEPLQGTPRVLVAGNANAGKTTIFNTLTGARARVGNYPGVTVTRSSRAVTLPSGARVELVDLPGTYSLSTQSPDERVAVDEVLGRRGDPPAAVVVAVDASAIERGLYLVLQIVETGTPVVVVLNMIDEAAAAGVTVDAEALGSWLGVDVVPTVASTGAGLDAVRDAIGRAIARAPRTAAAAGARRAGGDAAAVVPAAVPAAAASAAVPAVPAAARAAGDPGAARPAAGARFPPPVETAVAEVEGAFDGAPFDRTPAIRRAWAVWAILSAAPADAGEDEDEDVVEAAPARVRRAVDAARRQAAADGVALDREVIAARYRWIEAVVADVRRSAPAAAAERGWTDRLDAVLTHRLGGLAVFAIVMATLFEALFAWSEPFIAAIESATAGLQAGAARLLPDGPLQDLAVDGVIAGVGNVVVFVPQIAMLFLFIAVLEDFGYLARVAFVIDRLMGRIGLHGKAFVPMLSGFACAIPAVMATRTIESRRDRLITMLTLPMISCSARLPVYALVTAVVFAGDARVFGVFSAGAAVLFAMYTLSVAATLGAAAVLRRTVLRGPRLPLVLELPPYRLPVWRNVLLAAWRGLRKFLVDAGTIILTMTIILWALLSYPRSAAIGERYDAERVAVAAAADPAARAEALARIDGREAGEHLQYSAAGRLGRAIEPAIAPLGFDWRIGVGILGAFAAREVFVSTLGIVFGIAEADEESPSLRASLQAARRADGTPLMTPLAGVSLMVFFVLACQCMSTIGVVRRESGSWGWPVFMFGYMSVLAYAASLFVYQVGSRVGWGI